MPTFRNTLLHLHRHPPTYEDGIECSETSAYKFQTSGNHPKESIQHSVHGESLKSRRFNMKAHIKIYMKSCIIDKYSSGTETFRPYPVNFIKCKCTLFFQVRRINCYLYHILRNLQFRLTSGHTSKHLTYTQSHVLLIYSRCVNPICKHNMQIQ